MSKYPMETTETNLLKCRARQREDTRRQLLAAGLREVADCGFAVATTAAIVTASGKAHGTVFVHIATRDALVAELVEEVGRAMAQRLSAMPTGALAWGRCSMSIWPRWPSMKCCTRAC